MTSGSPLSHITLNWRGRPLKTHRLVDQTNAALPVIARPTMRVFISRVPSSSISETRVTMPIDAVMLPRLFASRSWISRWPPISLPNWMRSPAYFTAASACSRSGYPAAEHRAVRKLPGLIPRLTVEAEIRETLHDLLRKELRVRPEAIDRGLAPQARSFRAGLGAS